MVCILSVVPLLLVCNFYRFLPFQYCHPFQSNKYNFASSSPSTKFLDAQDETPSKFSFEIPKELLPNLHIVKQSHIEKAVILFVFLFLSFNLTCIFIFLMKASFSTFPLISSKVTSSSFIVWHNISFTSFSAFRAAITVSSNGTENFGISLERLSACPNFWMAKIPFHIYSLKNGCPTLQPVSCMCRDSVFGSKN